MSGAAASVVAAALPDDKAGPLQATVSGHLRGLLGLLRTTPQCVAELGGDAGLSADILLGRYPSAQIASIGPVSDGIPGGGAGARWHRIVAAEGGHLPLRSESIDLVFSSMALQRYPDLAQALAELRRIVRLRGFIVFALPTRGSLDELRVPARGASMQKPFLLPQQTVRSCVTQAGLFAESLETRIYRCNYPGGVVADAGRAKVSVSWHITYAVLRRLN